LPWQPNLDKINQNGTNFNSVLEFEELFAVWFCYGVGEFKYATWIFEGANRVAVATKIRQK